MKRFFKDQKGNALIWSLFIILILCTFSFVIYSAITVYSQYQACENDLQRAAIIATDKSMENANVRDIILNIPGEEATTSFETNLLKQGYIKMADDHWLRTIHDKEAYSLNDLTISIAGDVITIRASINIYLPWKIANNVTVSFPISAVSRVLYIPG